METPRTEAKRWRWSPLTRYAVGPILPLDPTRCHAMTATDRRRFGGTWAPQCNRRAAVTENGRLVTRPAMAQDEPEPVEIPVCRTHARVYDRYDCESMDRRMTIKWWKTLVANEPNLTTVASHKEA